MFEPEPGLEASMRQQTVVAHGDRLPEQVDPDQTDDGAEDVAPSCAKGGAASGDCFDARRSRVLTGMLEYSATLACTSVAAYCLRASSAPVMVTCLLRAPAVTSLGRWILTCVPV